MNRPGLGLRRIALRWCAPEVVERLIDPLVADLQFEHEEAERAGRRWAARWLRVLALVAFCRVFMHAWSASDDDGVGRALGYGAVTILAVTALFDLLPIW